MGLFSRLFLGPQLDAWASDYTVIAQRTLQQVAADLILNADREVEHTSLKECLIGQAAFIQTRIAPAVREVAEPVARSIMDEANAALLEIVEAQAVWIRRPEHAEGSEPLLTGSKDIAIAAVPFAAGAVAAASIPFAAVTTTTAMFGLVTTTVFSWPVAIGGGAVAALGMATGAVNAAKLRDRVQARLRARARRFILAALIEGSDRAPSILQQLAHEFHRAVQSAKTA